MQLRLTPVRLYDLDHDGLLGDEFSALVDDLVDWSQPGDPVPSMLPAGQALILPLIPKEFLARAVVMSGFTRDTGISDKPVAFDMARLRALMTWYAGIHNRNRSRAEEITIGFGDNVALKELFGSAGGMDANVLEEVKRFPAIKFPPPITLAHALCPYVGQQWLVSVQATPAA